MLNQCNFIGRLGKDPEVKYTNSGKAVASFSLACGEKRGGQEYTEWVKVVCWDKLAEIVGEHLTKGSQCFISGRMQTRKWQDQSGADRYITEIVAKEMKMLSPKQGGQQGPQNDLRNEQAYRDAQDVFGPVGDDVPF